MTARTGFAFVSFGSRGLAILAFDAALLYLAWRAGRRAAGLSGASSEPRAPGFSAPRLFASLAVAAIVMGVTFIVASGSRIPARTGG
jgi:hypothetical protein